MRDTVAVTSPHQRWLVEQITAGDSLDVVCLMGKNVDPETAEPTMSDLARLERATLFFTLGSLTPFERIAIGKIGDGNTRPTPVNTTLDIDLLTDEDNAASADPHVTASLRNLRAMAKVMAARLADEHPAMADRYRRQHQRLDSTLQALDDSISHLLDNAPSRAFIVWHPTFGYFARDYNLRQIAIDDGHELTARHLRDVSDSIRQSGARVMIIQEGVDNRMANAIARELHLTVITIDPAADNPIQQLQIIAHALSSAP